MMTYELRRTYLTHTQINKMCKSRTPDRIVVPRYDLKHFVGCKEKFPASPKGSLVVLE